MSFVGFLLTWLLCEVPLRKSAEAEGVAEHFAMPREAESLPELQRIVATARLVVAHASLRDRGLVDDAFLGGDGRLVFMRVVEARRQGLAELHDGWEPEKHDEVRTMLDRLARELVAEVPPAVPQAPATERGSGSG